MSVTEAEIEAAAEAVWNADHPRAEWLRCKEQHAYYRRNARLALEAAERVRANANQTGGDGES